MLQNNHTSFMRKTVHFVLEFIEIIAYLSRIKKKTRLISKTIHTPSASDCVNNLSKYQQLSGERTS